MCIKVAERSGLAFRLGQRVRARVVRADPDALKIDLALVTALPDIAGRASVQSTGVTSLNPSPPDRSSKARKTSTLARTPKPSKVAKSKPRVAKKITPTN